MTIAQNTSILEIILKWSADRPLWQRDALRRIVSKGKLGDADIQELVDFCKAGKAGTTIVPEPSPLVATHLPATPNQAEAVSLVSITDVQGVNNLALSQAIEFEVNGITIVYGNNGAGKSGYGRILKRACRARHAGKIEPNVYTMEAIPTTPTATFKFTIGGKLQPSVVWTDTGTPHNILSAISVFDRDCSSVHIRDTNEIAFRPFGLDVPDELAASCKKVKVSLESELKKAENEQNGIFTIPPWKDHTKVGKALAELSYKTKLEEINTLGTLSEQETSRLQQLREDLSRDPKRAFDEQIFKANNIHELYTTISEIADKISDHMLTNLWNASLDTKTKRLAANLAAGTAFFQEALEGVGGATWKILWDSARAYSTEVAYRDAAFPAVDENDLCVLCQQPLSNSAKERLLRFEDFIQKDVEKQASLAENELKTIQDPIANLHINFTLIKTNLQALRILNSVLESKTRRFLASLRVRRSQTLTCVASGQPLVLRTMSENPLDAIAKLEDSIRTYATELQSDSLSDERKKLVAEFTELKDRNILLEILPTIEQEIARLKLIYFLKQCIADTSTNAITLLGNSIADQTITSSLCERFQEEIVKLGANKVHVEFVRSGGTYGSPHYQIKLSSLPNAKVAAILSEGEQTCVGLAGFLTELATSSHCSGLVFDDPVSSLDHRWRKRVANRLVEEAMQRQIIIFTHDLIFVNDIYKQAKDTNRPVRCITVARGAAGAGIVGQGLPWQGKSVEDRIDMLEKATRTAKMLYNANQEDEYQEKVGKIYDDLRATWERAIEDVGLCHVVQRYRDYINTKDLKKVTVLTDQDCEAFSAGFQKCCDYVDAHDPSSARNAAPPTPDEIFLDINKLSDWVKSLRERQKKIS